MLLVILIDLVGLAVICKRDELKGYEVLRLNVLAIELEDIVLLNEDAILNEALVIVYNIVATMLIHAAQGRLCPLVI